MPNITGGVGRVYPDQVSGAFVSISDANITVEWQRQSSGALLIPSNLNASRSSSIYGSSDTVTPLAQKTNFVIKY